MDSKNIVLKFFYNTIIGRLILKLITLPVFSKIIGKYLNTRLSSIHINWFIKKNNININDYEQRKYISFNDFFTRKKNQIDKNDSINNFISPCDSKLMVYKINDNSVFNVKNSFYDLGLLLNNSSLAKKYKNGYAFIFRLSVDDYHRYIYIDNGTRGNYNHINGILHTVQGIALDKYKVFITNTREYTVMHTDNFDDIIQIEVGALNVGKINNFNNSKKYKRYDEKGKFEFGGSTIILLVKENVIKINKNILNNSKNNIETKVNIGKVIAKKL